MDEKALKTKTWQRVIILTVAILMVGAMMLSYMFIVMGGSSSGGKSTEDQIAELKAEYDAKAAEMEEKVTKPLSDKYFPEFSKYNSEVKAYNAANANAAGLATKDLKEGTGKKLEKDDTDYMAYYIGWCADGSIFDSSFNMENDKPVSLKAPLDPSGGLIEGWNQGVIGMKLGGVRQLTITGDLAYGDKKEICGGKNSPLKFIVMPIAVTDEYKKLNSELDEIYMQMYYLSYGGMVQ